MQLEIYFIYCGLSYTFTQLVSMGFIKNYAFLYYCGQRTTPIRETIQGR